MPIPLIDLKANNRPLKEEILALWSDILDNAAFIGGEHVVAFEREFAEFCQTRHAVAVGSGTDAIRFALMAMNIQPGDEIITTPNTFIATTEAITQAGGRPVFVDIEPDTCLIDPSRIETAITPRTKGIVPVHLYGQPAAMDTILRIAQANGLWVVEDAAQAHGAEYKNRRTGSMGTAAGFSFYPSKNLGACGEAGIITTQSETIADRIRMIRDHGQRQKYLHEIEGYNGRCDALQAAALRVKLRHLPEWTERRRALAALYSSRLADVPSISLPVTRPDSNPVWYLYVIQIDNRDAVQQALSERGIYTGLHFPVPLHLQQAYRHLDYTLNSFPEAEQCARRVLSLPMYPELTENDVHTVCDQLIEIIQK